MPTIAEALRELGSTEEQVAATLLARSIRGLRGARHRCPISNYLRATFAEKSSGRSWSPEFSVARRGDDESFSVERCMPGHTLEPDQATVPQAVSRFIRAFDEGGYPELVAKGDMP